jgi:hypothetical protein
MTQKSFGVAVIGAGMAGRAHAAGYRVAGQMYDLDLPDLRLVAIADAHEPFAVDAAKRFGYERAETSWEAVVDAPDVDVVSVVIANDLHRPVVEALLAAGNVCGSRTRSRRGLLGPVPHRLVQGRSRSGREHRARGRQLRASRGAQVRCRQPAGGRQAGRPRLRGRDCLARQSAQQVARHHDPLHLIGPLVDLGDLRVPHHPLHRIVLGVAVAAEELDRVGGDLHGDV